MRRAVIDIGTNSVKLLVAELKGAAINPLWEESEQTRLGQGFYVEHRLQQHSIEKTAQAVARFATKAQDWNPDSIRVIATSATRDAVNQTELLDAVRQSSGLEVEIISGEEEGELAYAGVRSNPALAGQALLILDVGGGSTEFILGRGEHPEFRQSFPLGSVRLMERCHVSDSPQAKEWEQCRVWVEAFLRERIYGPLQQRLTTISGPVDLVGTGGTPSILAAMHRGLTRFDRESIEQTILSREQIWEFQALLWRLPLAERKKIKGLPPNRADVMLFGVAVYALIMEVFDFSLLRTSTRGLRFGAVMRPSATPKPSAG